MSSSSPASRPSSSSLRPGAATARPLPPFTRSLLPLSSTRRTRFRSPRLMPMQRESWASALVVDVTWRACLASSPRRLASSPGRRVLFLALSAFSTMPPSAAPLAATRTSWLLSLLPDCKNLAPTWEKLAATFASEPEITIAKVDADAPNGKKSAAEYGVSGFPTIKFFPKGSTTPEDYNGGRSEADFVEFLNEKAGTHRTPGGGLDTVAGTLAALDEIVTKYTGGASLTEITEEAKEAVKSLKNSAELKYADYYLRVFDKLSKNEGYAAKEFARLEGILKKGGLAQAKVDELTAKVNVLRKFVEKAVEDVKDEL
ncbi:hypothetical protein SMACR_02589 [Sordaria macrospora]|uniref:protein disulfide-isomerase n=1 Tax=Sordaria macrospora TaxID=5147 RepID=A0A8S8ZYZ5_SORMA|nr:hypothetical protein SMACR_02589 [Sordaria macrospora]